MDQNARRWGLISGVLIFLIFFILLFLALRSGPRGRGPFWGKGKIGVIEVEGVVESSRELVEQVNEWRREKSIRAVVIRIDSPGGAVAPVQEIYEEILRLKEEKPVVASLGSVSASGGYYIACAADRIFANPGTLTGSIGVLMELLNLEGLLKWARIKAKIIKSGEYKDIGSPLREMTPEEEESLQKLVDGIHQQFVRAVSESRGLPLEKVEAIADGRVMSGEEAKALGLVDELGGFRRAAEYAAEQGGLPGEPVLVYPAPGFPRLRDLIKTIFIPGGVRLNFTSDF